jgi:hypothetical protein
LLDVKIKTITRGLTKLEKTGYICKDGEKGKACRYSFPDRTTESQVDRTTESQPPEIGQQSPTPKDSQVPTPGTAESQPGGHPSPTPTILIDSKVDSFKKEEESSSIFNQILEYWNSNCGLMPKANRLSDGRKALIRARIKEKGWLETFKIAVVKGGKCPFMLGQGPKGWKATIDFYLKNSTNVDKIVEGAYDGTDKRHTRPSGYTDPGTDTDHTIDL